MISLQASATGGFLADTSLSPSPFTCPLCCPSLVRNVRGVDTFGSACTSVRSFLFAVLPKDGPHITGGKPKYRVDEEVDVQCSVNRSKPAASLLWFINGEVADEKHLRGPYNYVSTPDDLESAILGLQFKVSSASI